MLEVYAGFIIKLDLLNNINNIGSIFIRISTLEIRH